jgi:hypothetical protein
LLPTANEAIIAPKRLTAQQFKCEAAASSQPVHRQNGLPDCGNSLAFELGGEIMRIFPFSITLIFRKTRTSWSWTVWVQFK